MNTRDIEVPPSCAVSISAMMSSSVSGAVSMTVASAGAAATIASGTSEPAEAELTALDQTQSANRDQFGITRPGTDEIDGHERVSPLCVVCCARVQMLCITARRIDRHPLPCVN